MTKRENNTKKPPRVKPEAESLNFFNFVLTKMLDLLSNSCVSNGCVNGSSVSCVNSSCVRVSCRSCALVLVAT